MVSFCTGLGFSNPHSSIALISSSFNKKSLNEALLTDDVYYLKRQISKSIS